jgi:predicted metal-dependent peptidase
MISSKDKQGNNMEIEEKLDLLRGLQPYGNMYYTFLNMSYIEFTNSTPTLAVYSDDEAGDSIILKINPEFWASIDKLQKLFVISHECLHVMLSHLPRLFRMRADPKFVMPLMNIAADLCVNETLVRHYKFIRSEIDLGWWWLDIAFPDQQVSYGMSMEYYYDLLMQEKDKSLSENSDQSQQSEPEKAGQFSDDHSGWMPISDEIIKQIIDNMDVSELEKFKIVVESVSEKNGGKEAGTAYQCVIKELENKKIVKKKKWESVIDRWVKSKMKVTENEYYQWARKNRRFVTLDSNFFLPTIAEMEKKKKEKVSIAFYLDTSGSCYNYAQRFYDAAKSVPLDKFDVRFFCFSTYVHEIDLKQSRLRMGGGTSFRIIEESVLKEFDKYPDGVFIITDGYGDNVVPKIPEKWFWFLTTGCDSCFPKTCKKFLLTNYE